MENKKFTDEEIFRAAEICFTPAQPISLCKECPYHDVPDDAGCDKFSEDLLDMLRRWKAERNVSAKD